MQAKLIVTQKIVKELMKSEAIRREIKDFKTKNILGIQFITDHNYKKKSIYNKNTLSLSTRNS